VSKSTAIPFETTSHIYDHCLCFAAQRAARALARRFDQALADVGLTNGQFSLLMSLNRPKPASIGTLAEFLVMDRTTLTANLKPLQRRGFLKIAVDTADRRGRLVTLTTKGHAQLQAAIPIWKRTHREAECALVVRDADEVRTGLRALWGV
jgi:DNA-binding MarR family transcriptional regulator